MRVRDDRVRVRDGRVGDGRVRVRDGMPWCDVPNLQ